MLTFSGTPPARWILWRASSLFLWSIQAVLCCEFLWRFKDVSACPWKNYIAFQSCSCWLVCPHRRSWILSSLIHWFFWHPTRCPIVRCRNCLFIGYLTSACRRRRGKGSWWGSLARTSASFILRSACKGFWRTWRRNQRRWWELSRISRLLLRPCSFPKALP